jgi:hypothetical protein
MGIGNSVGRNNTADGKYEIESTHDFILANMVRNQKPVSGAQ